MSDSAVQPSPDFQSSVTPTNHPLVANYSLTVPPGSTVSVEFGLTTSYGYSTSQVVAGAQGNVTILVAGMLAQTSYHMRALVQPPGQPVQPDVDHVFTTGPLPTGPRIFPELTVSDPGPWSPGVELITLVNPLHIFLAVDFSGNPVWYYLDPDYEKIHACAFAVKLLPNGNWMAMLTNRYTHVEHTNPYGAIREIDLAGNIVQGSDGPRQITLEQLNERLKNITTPQGNKVHANWFSHDILPLPNGHVIALCQEFRQFPVGEVYGDILVDLDQNFQPVWVWSIFEHLHIDRSPMGLPDWTHSNCLQATPDGNLLLSVRNQSWVVKIDYAGGTGSGEILWKLGYEGDFDLMNSGPANWFFAQHYPCIFATSGNEITTLSVVDNGNYRPASDPPLTSRGLILDIDESQKTASFRWQWPVSTDFYSFWGGDVVQLGNGNIEICMSDPFPGKSQTTEVTYGGEEIVWQMNMSPANAYRSYRLPSLYPGVQWD